MAATVLRTLALNFVARTENLVKGFGRMKREMRSVNAATSTARRALAAFGVGFSVSRLVANLKAATDNLDRLGAESGVLGITAQQLSAIEFAAEQADVPIGTLTKSFKALATTILNPTKNAAEAFRAIGVDMAAMAKLPLEKQFIAVGEALAKIQNPGKRLGLASMLFGKSGVDIIKLFQGGEFAPAFARGMELSRGITPESVKAADAFNDKMAETARIFKQMTNTVAISFLPAANQLMQKVADMAETFGKFTGAIPSATPNADRFKALQTNLEFARNNVKLLQNMRERAAAGEKFRTWFWQEPTRVEEFDAAIRDAQKKVEDAALALNEFRKQMTSKKDRDFLHQNGMASEALSNFGVRAFDGGPRGLLRGSAGAAEAEARFMNRTSSQNSEIGQLRQVNENLGRIGRDIGEIRRRQGGTVGID